MDFYTFVCFSRLETNSTFSSLCGKGGCVKDSWKHFSSNVHCYGHIWGFEFQKIGSQVCFNGYDGSSVFQGVRIGVTTQMKKNVVPFLMGIHFFTHQNNLVVLAWSKLIFVGQLEALLQAYWNNLIVLTLSKLHLVVQLEAFLQALYNFLSHSFK